jgi:hypothetical protein
MTEGVFEISSKKRVDNNTFDIDEFIALVDSIINPSTK